VRRRDFQEGKREKGEGTRGMDRKRKKRGLEKRNVTKGKGERKERGDRESR
jgi:hypothetical protein